MTSHGVHWRLVGGQTGYIAAVVANQVSNRPAVIDVHAHVHHESVIGNREAFAAQDAWFRVQNPPGSRRLSTVSHLVAKMDAGGDRKSTRLNSSHEWISRMPSSA